MVSKTRTSWVSTGALVAAALTTVVVFAGSAVSAFSGDHVHHRPGEMQRQVGAMLDRRERQGLQRHDMGSKAPCCSSHHRYVRQGLDCCLQEQARPERHRSHHAGARLITPA